MKLGEAAALCEANSRAFAEVYKLYNFKDEDDLKAYCDFVMHEPLEWMRGFPVAWKSVGQFSKPRAAFHRLLKQPTVIAELTEIYCDSVHNVIWNTFKSHMNTILEKRNGVKTAIDNDSASVPSLQSAGQEDALTAESFDLDDIVQPVPHVPVSSWPKEGKLKNTIVLQNGGAPTQKMVADLDYKHKYEVLHRVLNTILSNQSQMIPLASDENARLRAAFTLLLSEFSRV